MKGVSESLTGRIGIIVPAGDHRWPLRRALPL